MLNPSNMKLYLLIVVFLSIMNSSHAQYMLNNSSRDPYAVISGEILGYWELTQLMVDGEMMPFDSNRFYLEVKANGFRYSTEANTCTIMDWEFKDDYLSGDPLCTRVCCDERYGKTSEYLDYTGRYQLNDSLDQLMIDSSNGRSTLILKRVEEN